MTTTTVPAPWPTEASLEPAAKALAKAFNAVEAIEMHLDQFTGPWLDEGTYPDPPPTLATIGALYSFLETLNTEVAQPQMDASQLTHQLRQIDTMRLDCVKADNAS
jgi:hypothetical protein